MLGISQRHSIQNIVKERLFWVSLKNEKKNKETDLSHLNNCFPVQTTVPKSIKSIFSKFDIEILNIDDQFQDKNKSLFQSTVARFFKPENMYPFLNIHTNRGLLTVRAIPGQGNYMYTDVDKASKNVIINFGCLSAIGLESGMESFSPEGVGLFVHELHHAAHYLLQKDQISTIPNVYREVIGIGGELLNDCQTLLSDFSFCGSNDPSFSFVSKQEIPPHAWSASYNPSFVADSVLSLIEHKNSINHPLSFSLQQHKNYPILAARILQELLILHSYNPDIANEVLYSITKTAPAVLRALPGMDMIKEDVHRDYLAAFRILFDGFQLKWTGEKWEGDLHKICQEASRWDVDEWNSKFGHLL